MVSVGVIFFSLFLDIDWQSLRLSGPAINWWLFLTVLLSSRACCCPELFCGSPRHRKMWGTGMIASSSTFCPHPGRVIRDLFRQLHAVWHGTEALVYSNHPREAAASSYLAIIFGRIASGVPWLLCSTAVLMQLSHKCWRWCRLW